MKNKTLVILVLVLAAVMLFFVMLNNGREAMSYQAARGEGRGLSEEEETPPPDPAEQIKAVDDEAMKPETAIQLKYHRYPMTILYFVVGEKPASIYSSPNGDGELLRTAEPGEKLNYVETVVMQAEAAESEAVTEAADEAQARAAEGAAGGAGAEAEGAGAGAEAKGAGAGAEAKCAGAGAAGEAAQATAGGIKEAEDAQAASANPPEVWYHVYWYKDQKGRLLADGSRAGGEKAFGFIRQGEAEKRSFRLDDMMELLKKAEAVTSEGEITAVSNFRNNKGKPPRYRGEERDGKGSSRSQSAPGYPDLENKEEFTYLADGSLLKILEPETDGFRKVLSLADGKTYFVPVKYIPQRDVLSRLSKAVVIDRKSQNEAAFERMGDHWVCVSYTLATTGTTGPYSAPTPLGYFLMIQKRPQFFYYKDGTTQIQGYAPYVMRFCGGAYIHGVPVSYRYKDGQRITPPKREYSPTIGTLPLSHKCVRNYTSHAKFLYDWYEEGKTIVVVME